MKDQPRLFCCPLCGSMNIFISYDLNECIACCNEFDFADVVFDDGEDIY
jgi:hypothetical protein